MNFDLGKATIFLTLAGSRAYGFSSPTSDWDYRGICIPPLNTYIGINSKFEQAVDTGASKQIWKNYPNLVQPESDMQVMELSKFCRLAADCNPSVIEILFADESSIVKKHPVMDKLLANRDVFLSKRAKARFCGYALSQLKRIKRHKLWVDAEGSASLIAPKRSDYDLPEVGVISADQIGAADALIKQEIDGFMNLNQDELPEHVKIELDLGLGRMIRGVWHAINETPYPVGEGQTFQSTREALENAALRKGGYSENFIETLKREKRYRAALTEWQHYQAWLRDRNPERAALEKQFGYDTKHACHLVRLIRMCREILETGQVLVKRPDAEELRAIRKGAWSYTQVCEFAEAEDQALNEVVKVSKLPSAPDSAKIQELVYEMTLEFNGVVAR